MGKIIWMKRIIIRNPVVLFHRSVLLALNNPDSAYLVHICDLWTPGGPRKTSHRWRIISCEVLLRWHIPAIGRASLTPQCPATRCSQHPSPITHHVSVMLQYEYYPHHLWSAHTTHGHSSHYINIPLQTVLARSLPLPLSNSLSVSLSLPPSLVR